MTTAARTVTAPDRTILGVVSAGHFMSHYYGICLPVLFPLLHAELGVSYTALGFVLTLFHLASGAGQLPIGFLVDRFGAARVLVSGLAIEAAAILVMGISAEYALLLGLALVAGFGNAVFHPADYAILSEKIDDSWIGRAFSIHTFAGHLGSAAGPVVIGLLLLVMGWRESLVISGLIGFAVLAWALSTWGALRSPVTPLPDVPAESAGNGPPGGGAMVLLSTPMMLMFLFFVATSLTSSGVQSFSVTAFHEVQGLEAAAAGSVLSAYLFASAFGVLAGGYLADYTQRHDLIAIGAFAVTGAVMLLLGSFPVPLLLIALLYAVIGLLQGAVRPARDMMVRAATPAGGMGKAFGFVSMGISVGSAVAPVLFGWLVDHGRPQYIFYAMALFMVVGVVSVGASRQAVVKRQS